MSFNRLRDTPGIGLLGLILLGTQALAQAPAASRGVHPDRLRLEERARAADSAGRHEEAGRIRSRLQNGDFKIGDRVIVTFEGLKSALGDTLVVQSGLSLRLGEPMGELPLVGILRFELADSVSNRVTKYFRNALVHVTPLARINVSGAVRNPGYYYARTDTPLSDLVTRTAGQDQSTDLADVTVKRGNAVIWAASEVQSAFRDGLTLEALGLGSGDDVIVGARSNPWPTALQYGLPIVSALLITLVIRR